jgi:peroxiredoxin
MMTPVFVLSLALLWLLTIYNTLLLLALARKTLAAPPTGVSDSGGLSVMPPSEARQGELYGKPAPPFRIEDLGGNVMTTGDLLGNPAALLFVSPDCATCGVTLDELETLTGKVSGNIVVICRSHGERCAEMAKTYGLGEAMVADADYAISRLFRVAVTPTAVLLTDEGIVESYGRPMSPDDLRGALEAAGWNEVDEADEVLGHEKTINEVTR